MCNFSEKISIVDHKNLSNFEELTGGTGQLAATSCGKLDCFSISGQTYLSFIIVSQYGVGGAEYGMQRYSPPLKWSLVNYLINPAEKRLIIEDFMENLPSLAINF